MEIHDIVLNFGILLLFISVGAFFFYVMFRRCECGAFYHTKEEKKKFWNITFVGIFMFVLGITILIIEFDAEGDYIIQNQWIASDYNNISYCDNCLWIEFYEGCNRYSTYYFEEQHELDKRFIIGTPVNIDFKQYNDKFYIEQINPAKRYRSKC